MLGFERQKVLMGCTDNSECIAEIGGALGVDQLVSGRIGRLGDTYVLELRRTDVRRAKTIASALQTATGSEDAIIEAIRQAVARLYGAAAPTPLVAVEKPAQSKGGAGWTVLGSIMTVAGAGGVAFSLKMNSDYNAQQGSIDPNSWKVTREDARRVKVIYPIAWGVGGLGVLTTVFGIYRLASSPGADAVSFAPVPGGGVFAVQGSF